MSVTIIVKHKRFKSAQLRGEYIEKVKIKRNGKEKIRDQGRVPYIMSGDDSRVARLWGKLPDGIEVKPGVNIGAALMLHTNTAGRSEVIEFLVSASVNSPRQEAVKAVDEIVDRMMEKYFPGICYLAARHGDTAHVHAHVLLPNDDGYGHCLSISKKQFLELRRDIAKWSGVAVKSAWPGAKQVKIGKASERLFARLTKQQMEAEALAGRLHIHCRDKKTGYIKSLRWQGHGQASSYGEIIRFWVCARLESRLTYGLTEIEMAISIWHQKRNRMLAFVSGMARQEARLPENVKLRQLEHERIRDQELVKTLGVQNPDRPRSLSR